MKSVILSNNRFSEKGIGQLISSGETNMSLDLLDLSDCSLGDGALERLAPLIESVRELLLTDNNFTR